MTTSLRVKKVVLAFNGTEIKTLESFEIFAKQNKRSPEILFANHNHRLALQAQVLQTGNITHVLSALRNLEKFSKEDESIISAELNSNINIKKLIEEHNQWHEAVHQYAQADYFKINSLEEDEFYQAAKDYLALLQQLIIHYQLKLADRYLRSLTPKDLNAEVIFYTYIQSIQKNLMTFGTSGHLLQEFNKLNLSYIFYLRNTNESLQAELLSERDQNDKLVVGTTHQNYFDFKLQEQVRTELTMLSVYRLSRDNEKLLVDNKNLQQINGSLKSFLFFEARDQILQLTKTPPDKVESQNNVTVLQNF